MTESDYKKLVSEYEKLYEERPDLYYRSFEEYIAYLTRAKEKFLHKGKRTEVVHKLMEM
ncbi:MAG: hypothetical protein J5825_10545 [Lachnospiraceae bacterium]|nr:hypothetical protein [Lachnospiraceae bacterium]